MKLKSTTLYTQLREDLKRQREEIDRTIAFLDRLYYYSEASSLSGSFHKLAVKASKIARTVQPNGTRGRILDFIQRHPKSKTIDISKGLRMERGTVTYHLTRAKRSGQAKMEGMGMNTTWSLEDSKHAG